MAPFMGFLDLRFAEDGEKLMEYLHSATRGKNPEIPLPQLIILNLNMPRKNGCQALIEINDDPKLKHIPVVVLTTSSIEEEKRFCIEAGARAFFTKPNAFPELQSAVRSIVEEWFPLPS